MFDFIQKHRRFAQIFLALIAITFATWGIESYTRYGGNANSVASVNGYEISLQEFTDQLRAQQESIRRMFRGQIDPAALDTPEARRAVLDQMITQRVVFSEAGKRHLFIGRDAVIEAITQAPEFQENGKFSPALYSAYLAQRGLSDANNVAQLQTELPVSRLVRSVTQTAIAPHSLAARLAAIQSQKREVAQAQIPAKQFLDAVKIDEAKVKEYYEAHKAEFRTPERVRAQYVMLSAQALARQEPVSEAEIQAAYDARAPQYKVEEQRRASHVLVKDEAEAKKIAAEVKKHPDRFAALAKQASQDTGSAGKGGDLGWFGRGMMVKPFEDAVFEMKPGEVRVVQSEFGYHVVRLDAVQAARARPLAEVKKEIAEELAQQKGARKFAEVAESFSNMVYEQSDSLAPVAERFKLPIQTTDWIERGRHQELGALDNAKLLSALFSPDAVQHRRNTDAIEVAPNTLVSARVVEHQPERQREFAEVKDEIAAELRRREALALARKDGEAKLAELRRGGDPVKWSAPREVSRRDPGGLRSEALRRVVAADVAKLPAYVGLPTEEGYLLIRISKVTEVPPQGDPRQLAAQAEQLLGQTALAAYLASLRSQADISINQENLEKSR
ncbi:MAG TPA: SurA N-terminal domain-containing protein [Burkholderiales bacterium]